jgi:hypothetical protein
MRFYKKKKEKRNRNRLRGREEERGREKERKERESEGNVQKKKINKKTCAHPGSMSSSTKEESAHVRAT